MFNVKDIEYGAKGDGVADDRKAIQMAIDACAAAGGGEVFFPVGVYLLKNAGSNAFCIKLANKVRLVGESRARSIIKQAVNLVIARLVQIESNDCGLSNLTLDGNKAKQSVDEHRSGIFARNAKNLAIKNVTSQNFTGDGFYIGSNVSQVMFANVMATLNGRDGIALAGNGNISDIKIINSTFFDNAAQQIDSEPKKSNLPDLFPQVNNVTISGCIIDPGNSNDYAVTCSGDGEGDDGWEDKNRSHGWTITGNIIKGSVAVVWCDDVSLIGNMIDNPTTKPCVEILRTAKNIVVTKNRISKTSTTGAASIAAIYISGKREGSVYDVPSLVSITNNSISVSDPRRLAVLAQGAESVSMIGNQIDGGGIQIRATAFGSAVFRSAIITGNTISNVRHYGIVCTGDKQPPAAGRFAIVDISHNVIDDPDPIGILKYGIYFETSSLFDDQIFFDGKKLNADIQITLNDNHIRSRSAPLTNFQSVPY